MRVTRTRTVFDAEIVEDVTKQTAVVEREVEEVGVQCGFCDQTWWGDERDHTEFNTVSMNPRIRTRVAEESLIDTSFERATEIVAGNYSYSKTEVREALDVSDRTFGSEISSGNLPTMDSREAQRFEILETLSRSAEKYPVLTLTEATNVLEDVEMQSDRTVTLCAVCTDALFGE